MNNIAISNHVFLYALQNQNIDRKIAKTIDISTLSNDVKVLEKEKIESNLEVKESSNIEDLPTINTPTTTEL